MFKTVEVNTNEKLHSTAFWSVIGITAFILIQKNYEFHFYYMEQFQLFLYNKTFLSDLFFSFGGLSEIISRWLLQFYIYPWAGALITTSLLLSVAVLMNQIAIKISKNRSLILLPILSAIFLFFLHLNHNYYITGTISFIFVLTAFLIYLNIDNYKVKKIIVATLLTVLLFWLAGSVAFLFAIAIIILQLLIDRKHILYSFLPLALIFILAYIGVNSGWIGDYSLVFSPLLYYHHKMTPSPLIYYSWCLFLLLIFLTFVVNDIKISRKLHYFVFICQIVIVSAVIYFLLPKYGQLLSAQYKQLDYYTRMGRFDEIIEESKKPINNLLHAYYLNIALMETDQLGKQFLQFDQKGINGLIPIMNKELASLITLNELNFTLGDIAASQNFAFESNITISKTGSPRLYKRLVQTNLISGDYPVAEKYINLLEQTHYYKEWATNQRHFLYNDMAVENDELLGTKRRGLPAENYLLGATDLIYRMQHLVNADPDNTAAKEYLASVFLFGKQMPLFIELIDKYYNTEEALLNLPERFQEAIIIINENNPTEWDRYKINPLVVSKYEDFKQLFLEKRNNANISNIMYHKYGNTYWFYFMFYN